MDMLERPLTADEEAMDSESDQLSLTFFTIDNGVAQSAADGSLIWLIQLPSGQHNLEEEQEDEAAEFFHRASDDGDGDGAAHQSVPEFVGYPTEDSVQQGNSYLNTVVTVNLLALQQGVDFETVLHRFVHGDGAYDGGGAGVVPASDAAVAGLEKHAFHATAEGCDDSESCVTGCAICLEEFEDGEEVTVMPCYGGHEFHPGCITEWLGRRNTCPLCRHALPAAF